MPHVLAKHVPELLGYLGGAGGEGHILPRRG